MTRALPHSPSRYRYSTSRAATSSGRSRLIEIKREGHVYDEETRREVYERILGFLDQHLMAVQP